jgi:regulator of sirC expression with transglutaminase-like and TPR domain
MDMDLVVAQYDKVRRSLWLEINSYLSPIEQVSVFNTTLFGYHKLQGQELSKRDPKYFFLNYLLESRQGNAYSIGILYLSLCERLDIPLFALDIPRQFVFAYIDTIETSAPHSYELDFVPNIRFYVDPGNGNIYSQRDIDTYLQRIGGGDRELYFTPLTPRRILWRMMEELSACYKYCKEDQKAREIQALMQLLID